MAPLWVTPRSQAVVYVSPLEVNGGILRKSVRSKKTLSVIAIDEAKGISKSYVSRILRLALLAPDIEVRHLRMIHVHHDVEREVGAHAKLYANDGTLIGPNEMGASVATA
jgi:hypothetical protein